MVMLESALCAIKDELCETGLFKPANFFEYCELIDRNGAILPCYYIGNGNWKEIYDLDQGASAYIRKNGDMSVRKITDEKYQVVGCSDSNPLIEVSYYLRLVASNRKKALKDSPYSDEILISEIIATLGKKQPAIPDISSVIGDVTRINTDHLSVFNQECKNIKKQIDFTISYIAIDFNLKFIANLDCLKNQCSSYG